MSLLTYKGSQRADPKIAEWQGERQHALGRLAAQWFAVMRRAGADVTELLHDGYPTVCVGDYPFAYVGVFKAHVNVGFFQGAHLPDPQRLLEGTGKNMRHVKVRPGAEIASEALEALIEAAYRDIKERSGA